MKYFLKSLFYFPKTAAILLIELYQATFSPDHGWFSDRFPYGFCRHFPSCSQYAKEAIVKFGLLKGIWLGFKRVLRCNPFARPGIDHIS